jgi:L-amino acid N-acyltransferase YncA
MEKNEKLKDGTEITIRELTLRDLDKLMRFYRDLPLEDRTYLKFDVTDRKVVAKRLSRIETGEDARIIALHKSKIIASGALELSGEQWSRHQAEIRVIIARPLQHKGLGTIMIRELYSVAVQRNVDLVIAKLMRPQVAALNIFRKLGFREQLLPDFVKDLKGWNQDLIVMTSNIKDLWKQLDQTFAQSDWQRCR